MTTATLDRPRPAATSPLTTLTTVWGVLLSSYSEASGGISVWSTADGALRHAERIVAARPGIEFELVTCTGNGPWHSVSSDLGIHEVMAARWPS